MTLQKIRERIAALQDERAEVERAWPSADECRAGIESAVELLARDGRRALSPAFLRQGRIDSSGVAALPLIAVLDPERLAAGLANLALSEYPEAGISAPDRTRRLAEIAREIHKLGIEEEILIRRSLTPVARRGDADPSIVLDPFLNDAAALAA